MSLADTYASCKQETNYVQHQLMSQDEVNLWQPIDGRHISIYLFMGEG